MTTYLCMVVDMTVCVLNQMEAFPKQGMQECVAVLTMLYKKNGAVTGVGSDFLSDWALHLANPSSDKVK